MKLNQKHLTLTIIPLVFLLLYSCSDKLNNDKAKELIIQKFGESLNMSDQLQHGELNYSGGSNIYEETTLANQKLITFTYQGVKRDMFFSYQSYYLELTPEGQKYKVGETADNQGRQYYLMKAADKVFGQITGIREVNNGEQAEVDFTWVYKNVTPFGQAITTEHQQLGRSDDIYAEGQIVPATVMMAKYNDGWRISQ